MAVDNTVTLTGNVTRDTELTYTNGGSAVASFGLAVNRRWQNRQTQEWEEQVSFFDIKAWAQLAENAKLSVYKGDRVTVVGRLDQSTWEDKESGKNRSKVEVIADDISLSIKWATVPTVTKNEKGAQGGGGGGRPQAQGGRPDANAGNSGGRGAPQGEQYGSEEPF